MSCLGDADSPRLAHPPSRAFLSQRWPKFTHGPTLVEGEVASRVDLRLRFSERLVRDARQLTGRFPTFSIEAFPALCTSEITSCMWKRNKHPGRRPHFPSSRHKDVERVLHRSQHSWMAQSRHPCAPRDGPEDSDLCAMSWFHYERPLQSATGLMSTNRIKLQSGPRPISPRASSTNTCFGRRTQLPPNGKCKKKTPNTV